MPDEREHADPGFGPGGERTAVDPAPHDDAGHLLFGTDDHDGPIGGADLHPDLQPGQPSWGAGRRAAVEQHRHRRHRRGPLIALVGFVIVATIGIGAYYFVRNSFSVPDYSGSGTTPVTVVVHSGDTASAIADTLVRAGVVKSAKAFTNATNNDAASATIQPGIYTLRKQMSGASALSLLLTPSARSPDSDVVVTEGATIVDVAARLAKALGTSTQAVRAAMTNVSQLALPSTYGTGSVAPTSAEGFLYPATYNVDPGAAPMDVINAMITKFIDQDRTTNFAAAAAKLRLTPYQELIVASIAQAEAKFADDMPRVARVILNRIAARTPLQIDATSAYAAKLRGLDPTKIIYSTIDSPYNTYTHDGLPPTPISNPGVDALAGAAAPAAGNWLYYVNSDAEGHLFFTNDQTAFAAAVAKCRANNWGCG